MPPSCSGVFGKKNRDGEFARKLAADGHAAFGEGFDVRVALDGDERADDLQFAEPEEIGMTRKRLNNGGARRFLTSCHDLSPCPHFRESLVFPDVCRDDFRHRRGESRDR